MNSVNQGHAEIEEVSTELTAAEDLTIYQALADAQLSGYESIVISKDRRSAIVTWYVRRGG